VRHSIDKLKSDLPISVGRSVDRLEGPLWIVQFEAESELAHRQNRQLKHSPEENHPAHARLSHGSPPGPKIDDYSADDTVEPADCQIGNPIRGASTNAPGQLTVLKPQP
jgi:hypothetical protein